jgi:recombination protein RecA
MAEAIDDFIARINKTYKSTVMRRGSDIAESLQVRRFSSGVVSADCALGGGWPFGRICIIAGEYSSGKTVMALKAATMVNQYDHQCHLHQSRVKADDFTPGRCLLVDAENSFDEKWAKVHGWDSSLNVVAQPEYAEQAVDIVTDAIRGNMFDLIVVDSIAAFTPSKEVEESSEDWQMGLAARLTNKAMRRWVASLSRVAQENTIEGTCVLCLNQFRLRIGQMFGDPRVLPCGKGQEFAASVIVYTKSPKVVDNEKAEHGMGEYGGYTHKNKTAVPKVHFKYRMALKDHDGDLQVGEVDNFKQLMILGKKYELIGKDGSKWKVGADRFDTLKEIEAKLQTDEAFRALVWRSVVKAFGGDTVV